MAILINPETKVGAVLDAYPGIDDVLIEWVPAFARLKNPILRKTVAKLATLEQAAEIGGVSVRDLVMKLRSATGQAGLEVVAQEEASSCTSSCGHSNVAPPPSEDSQWLEAAPVMDTIDGVAMLEMGIHPIGRVRQAADTLESGQCVVLLTPFSPAPLHEAMRHAGFAVHAAQTAPGRFSTWIGRK
jgi:hypothetical protein